MSRESSWSEPALAESSGFEISIYGFFEQVEASAAAAPLEARS